MAKVKKAWFCTSCGNESAKWMGKCPACGEWNTMQEEIVSKEGSSAVPFGRGGSRDNGHAPRPEPLSAVSSSEEQRVLLGISEMDRILGGGLVKGSMVLIGGEPGIGKSTLSLQIPLHCPQIKTLYVS